MRSSIRLLLASAAMVVTQTTTIDVVFPVEAVGTMTGTVVSVDPSLTTFAIHCADDANNAQCHILSTQTVVEGPSTLTIQYFHASDSQAGYFSEDLACNLDRPGNAATCTVTVATVNDKSETVTRMVVTTQPNLSKMYRPAVITEGAEKLIASGSTVSTANPASTTKSTITSTSSISSGQVAQTFSAVGSGSGSSVASDTPASSSPAVIQNAARGMAAGPYILAALAVMVVALMTL